MPRGVCTENSIWLDAGNGLSSWLVAGIVPGVERHPLKKPQVDESALLKLLHRWQAEAEKAGYRIKREQLQSSSNHVLIR